MFLTGTRKQEGLTGVERRPRRQESAIMLWQQSPLGDTHSRLDSRPKRVTEQSTTVKRQLRL